MYIQHITLTTGHVSHSPRTDVSGETLARVRPWLVAALVDGQSVPLPTAGLSDYEAHIMALGSCLLLTVSGLPTLSGPRRGNRPPLVTMGVAARPRDSAPLWRILYERGLPGSSVAPGLSRPESPWCGVVLHPTITLDMAATEWLGDFERCVAWAWVTP